MLFFCPCSCSSLRSSARRTCAAAIPLQPGGDSEQFVGRATHQRELWQKNTAWTGIPPELVLRLRRVNSGLRFLLVAEDWCPDSVNTVPYSCKLARWRGWRPASLIARSVKR